MMRLAHDLMRGSLDLLILSVLAEEPLYGYRLLKKLRTAGGKLITIQAGAMYPILHRLEGTGAITSRWDNDTNRPRKWYYLTAKGQRMLTEQAGQWRHYADCVKKQLEQTLTPSSPESTPEPA